MFRDRAEPRVIQREPRAGVPSPPLLSDAVDIKKESRMECMRRSCHNWIATKDISADQRICSICLDPFEANAVLVTLPCFHIFHQHCIEEWFCKCDDLKCPECETCIINPNA